MPISQNKNESKCIFCKNEIDADATLCSTCGSHQARWKNELKYWGGVASFLALLASGAAFTFKYATDISYYLSSHEVAVVEINSFSESTLWNTTNYPILIESVDFNIPAEKLSFQLSPSLIIKANELASFDLQKIVEAQLQPSMRKLYNGTYVGPYMQKYRYNEKNVPILNEWQNRTHVVSIVYADGATAKFLANSTEELITTPCTALISYREGFQGKKKSNTFSCIGYPRHLLAPSNE